MRTGKTKQEKVTAAIEKKAVETLREDYPDYFDKTKFDAPKIYFMSYINPHQILRFDIKPVGPKDDKDDEYIYIVWDNKEAVSYDDADEAYNDVLVAQRELQLSQKWIFFGSPLFISGILAILLFSVIAALVLRKIDVPSQLWSIFTAVVAFYFGKEGWTILKQKEDSDG